MRRDKPVRVVEESSVPWEELFGYMPEITDGLPVADYLEGIRGGGGARQALADQWRRTAAEPAALRALIEWALADRESRTHDLQGELLIPLWLIGARASAIEEKK